MLAVGRFTWLGSSDAEQWQRLIVLYALGAMLRTAQTHGVLQLRYAGSAALAIEGVRPEGGPGRKACLLAPLAYAPALGARVRVAIEVPRDKPRALRAAGRSSALVGLQADDLRALRSQARRLSVSYLQLWLFLWCTALRAALPGSGTEDPDGLRLGNLLLTGRVGAAGSRFILPGLALPLHVGIQGIRSAAGVCLGALRAWPAHGTQSGVNRQGRPHRTGAPQAWWGARADRQLVCASIGTGPPGRCHMVFNGDVADGEVAQCLAACVARLAKVTIACVGRSLDPPLWTAPPPGLAATEGGTMAMARAGSLPHRASEAQDPPRGQRLAAPEA